MISKARLSSKVIDIEPRVVGPIMPIRPETSPRAISSFLIRGFCGFNSREAMVFNTFIKDAKNGFTNSARITFFYCCFFSFERQV
ncbi:Uncharacterised protein [Vibrio cholerae]|nr:Uncharacterised protein [Vibrio cholerae]